MANTFIIPNCIVCGENALEKSKEHLSRFGNKALIITDEMMVKLKNVEKITNILSDLSIEYEIYSGVNSEPNVDMVYSGKEIFVEKECDFMIAVGGGSPIDTMKAISMVLVHGGLLSDYIGKDFSKEVVGMVAIPTTAGTGSEATKFTIITDESIGVKMLLKGDCLIPKLAIVDPVFTLSAPKSVTVYTGIDALCHAIEAYTSRKHQTLSDTFALSAIKRIFNNLKKCVENPENLYARNEMAIAALEAGIAFNNSSVTIVHGMSRPFGALFHIPHGLSNAILLCECMRFVVDGAYDRFNDIAKVLNIEGNLEESSLGFIKHLDEFISYFNLPKLKDMVDREKYYSLLDKMSEDALISGSPANTIKNINKEDIIKIYKEIY